jgi:hypothetical protein
VTGISGSVAATTVVCVEVGTGTCSTTASTSGNFYILNGGTTPQVVGEHIVTGTLTAISGGSASLPGTGTIPYSIAVAPNGKFLCVSTNNGVLAYMISSSGALGSAVQVSLDQPYAIQVDTTNSWLIEAIPATGGMSLGAVPISPTTGAFVSGSTVPTATFSVTSAAVQPNQMAISQDNSNIFVALGAGGTIVVPFDHTGPFPGGIVAKKIAVANAGGSALSVAVDPSATPRLFYIGEVLGNSGGTSGGLRVFTYASLSTASLVQATGSPIASGGLAPSFILPTISGTYVYVANGAGTTTAGNVSGFTVTASTVTAGSTATVGIQPLGLAEDSTGAFVFSVGSLGSPYFDAFTFDTSTAGKLDSQITSTTAVSSVAVVAAP